MSAAGTSGEPRLRREPPRFRRLTVREIRPLSPHMVRVTVTGEELVGFSPPEPAASIRLLIPSTGTTELVMPVWQGNEFLLPNGERPVIRTFTPRRYAAGAQELDIDIVLHDGGAASSWAEEATVGNPVAISGPGRGYSLDPDAESYFLAGDETAIPAIGQLLEAIASPIPLRVTIEVGSPDARLELPARPGADITWVERGPEDIPGAALIEAVTTTDISPGIRVWVAGEAGSLVQIRTHLFDELGFERSQATVRGYWKHGR